MENKINTKYIYIYTNKDWLNLTQFENGIDPVWSNDEKAALVRWII